MEWRRFNRRYMKEPKPLEQGILLLKYITQALAWGVSEATIKQEMFSKGFAASEVERALYQAKLHPVSAPTENDMSGLVAAPKKRTDIPPVLFLKRKRWPRMVLVAVLGICALMWFFYPGLRGAVLASINRTWLPPIMDAAGKFGEWLDSTINKLPNH
jgi:hypothetical protein